MKTPPLETWACMWLYNELRQYKRAKFNIVEVRTRGEIKDYWVNSTRPNLSGSLDWRISIHSPYAHTRKPIPKTFLASYKLDMM